MKSPSTHPCPKDVSLSQAVLSSLAVFAAASVLATMALWFVHSRSERSQWLGDEPANLSISDRSERRSALATEFAADVAFIQMPLSVMTLIFLAISVLANNRALRLAQEANSTSSQALALEERTRRITLRAYLQPRLTHGVKLNRTQFLDRIAPAATFLVVVDNSGQTPAIKVRLSSTIRVTEDAATVAAIDFQEGSDFPNVPALKSDTITLRQAVLAAEDPVLSADQRLFVRARVTYEDVFGDLHGFDFVWELEHVSLLFRAFRENAGSVEVNLRTVPEFCRSW